MYEYDVALLVRCTLYLVLCTSYEYKVHRPQYKRESARHYMYYVHTGMYILVRCTYVHSTTYMGFMISLYVQFMYVQFMFSCRWKVSLRPIYVSYFAILLFMYVPFKNKSITVLLTSRLLYFSFLMIITQRVRKHARNSCTYSNSC